MTMNQISTATIIEENIPATLRESAQWVCWKYRIREDKKTKVPYNAATGREAKTNDAKTWVSFARATAALSRGGYDGIGFVLTDETGIVGGDLDHCINTETGELHDWADCIITKMHTYTEITPSGEGLRFFARGVLPPTGRKKGDLEMYTSGRFLTITGKQWAGSSDEIESRQSQIDALHSEYFGKVDEVIPVPQNGHASGHSNGHSNGNGHAANDDDTSRLALMLASKNSAKVRSLWEGAWQPHYNSQSEADSALCFHLAFWFQKDESKVDSMFRQSGLMREKWDKAHHAGGVTYGAKTVQQACLKTKESYSPAPKGLLRGKAANRAIRGADKSEIDAAQSDGEDEAGEGDDEDERALNNGIYAMQNGRTTLSVEKEKSDEKSSNTVSQRGFVWDGAAGIFGEISDEDGTTIYEIEGRTIHNRHFTFELEASRMADPKAVAGTISNFAGAETVVYAGMEKHLTPSIRSFTDRKQLRYQRRFSRVGWTRDGKEFIIPGLEPSDVIMALGKDMAYRVEAGEAGVLTTEAIDALTALLVAHRREMTTVALAHTLLAPLAQLGEWRDDKFALFIAGRTGSFKTSWAAMLMCLYGDFANEDRLLKFGMGGTNNALMAYTSKAADVPLLIDNFKPGTGNGQKDAQTLIHGVIEGGEKKRLNRDGTLRDSKEIHCWPVLTGEDVIDDAAAIARMLIVIARWDGGENPALTNVQGMSHILPQVGGAWLQWLMSPGAKSAVASVKPHFYTRRSKWSAYLREHAPDMVNISRVASSLALCECSWEIALQCPALSPVLSQFTGDLQNGLIEVAAGMGNYAAQTHEANRYISAVRAMVLSNRGYLLERHQDPDKDDRRAFLGWMDNDHVYLQPETAYREVLEFLRNQNGLNGLGMNTVHRQLEQMGHIAKRDGKHIAALKRVGADSRAQRLLWISRDKIFGEDQEEENSDEENM